MANWKEKLGERIVGDCFGGYASHICNVAPAKPSSAYTEEIKEKFIFATSQKSKSLKEDNKDTLVKDFGSKLTNKIIGVSR